MFRQEEVKVFDAGLFLLIRSVCGTFGKLKANIPFGFNTLESVLNVVSVSVLVWARLSRDSCIVVRRVVGFPRHTYYRKMHDEKEKRALNTVGPMTYLMRTCGRL